MKIEETSCFKCKKTFPRNERIEIGCKIGQQWHASETEKTDLPSAVKIETTTHYFTEVLGEETADLCKACYREIEKLEAVITTTVGIVVGGCLLLGLILGIIVVIGTPYIPENVAFTSAVILGVLGVTAWLVGVGCPTPNRHFPKLLVRMRLPKYKISERRYPVYKRRISGLPLTFDYDDQYLWERIYF